jgi:hypothetical protein
MVTHLNHSFDVVLQCLVGVAVGLHKVATTLVYDDEVVVLV